LPFPFQNYRPNPFRNITPRIQHWLFPLFYKHNDWHLKKKFSLKPFSLREEDARILKRIHDTPGGHLIVANHTSFMEPHVVMEILKLGALKPSSMAGNDVLEGLFGFQGWYTSLSGAFSVDRGILDKRALMVAQNVLDTQVDPLIVYPEGEADYTNRVVRPFQSGAFTFALKHAEKKLETRFVTWLTPIAICYRHLSPPQNEINTAIKALSEAIQEDYPELQIPERLTQALATPWEKLQALTKFACDALYRTHPRLAPQRPQDLSQQLSHLRHGLLESLCQEHAPELLSSLPELDYTGTMGVKNRLRSLIARKAYAPERARVENALHTLKKSPSSLKTIQNLEYHWLGLGISRYYQDESLEKRQQRLEEHLNQILPWSDSYAAANDTDKARWQRQMNETRQAKILWLLQEDLLREDTSWDALDETLVKLEILTKSWFRYRGNKAVSFKVGEPIDVQAFFKENQALSKRERLQQLTDSTHDTIQTMVDALFSKPAEGHEARVPATQAPESVSQSVKLSESLRR
jgi:1-acyl-sn-glycerol-3-phosphate acyltransferase